MIILKFLLSLFIVNNIFLFLRTFKAKNSKIDKNYFEKNMKFYEDNEINIKILLNRVSKLLLKDNSILSRLLVYYIVLFPILWILELLNIYIILFKLPLSSISLYCLFFSVMLVNFFYFYNKDSVIVDRSCLIIKISILLLFYFV